MAMINMSQFILKILKVSVYRFIFLILAVITRAFLIAMNPKETQAYTTGRVMLLFVCVSQVYQIIIISAVVRSRKGER
jgi:hypothetical protein